MAVTWKALAILGTFALASLALLAAQNSRFDGVHQRLDEAVRELRSDIRAVGDRLA